MSYRFVLLDADNTLLDFTRSECVALSECLIKRDIQPTDELIARYSEINDDFWKMLERGEVTREALRVERFAKLFREYGFSFDPAEMAEDYLVALSTKSYLMDGAFEFCKNIHGKCRMFVITNGNTSVQKGRFDPCPLAPMFENCFISEEIGHSKPEKAYFDAVASMIPGFDAREAVVVGDSLSSDIQGGINAGIDTCWFNPKRKSVPRDLPVKYVVHSFDELEKIILS